MHNEERLISLDTETTGFDPETGDRIVEIGAVELLNDMPTGRKLHLYINPERDVPAEAFKVHGLDNKFLSDKPVFSDIVDEFLAFIGDSRMVIHNAAFDMKFINSELERAGRTELPKDRAIDSLQMAKRQFPTSPASLDALCRRFGISTEKRELHGALLDSELLAEVWLGLNGGRQPEMMLTSKTTQSQSASGTLNTSARQRPHALAGRVHADEMAAHAAVMRVIDASARKSSKGAVGAVWAPETESSPSP